jgi:hypothetical protein
VRARRRGKADQKVLAEAAKREHLAA